MAMHLGGAVRGLLLAVLILPLINCGHRISGNFSATFSNGFYWLQLVQTSSEVLSGQLETFIVVADRGNCHDIWLPDPSGYGNKIKQWCGWKVQHDTVPLVGNVDGENIFLRSVTPGISLSGILKENQVNLTGWSPSSIEMKRAEFKTYQQQLNRWALFTQAKNTSTFPQGLHRCAAFWDTNCISYF
jgi:hypothetical protein